MIRNSWDAERNETLLYLRVYSDGFAETDPMRNVDFRNIQLEHRQLSSDELSTLRSVLSDPATRQLLPEYDRHWGNKDFGYKFDVRIFASEHEQRLKLVNFQPFLAREKGRPYPREVEKLGCTIWRLRVKVSGEPLDRDWLAGCAKLGY
ncbi:MAG TPA: hypothetical protein VGN39_12805 [Terriglobales bacterium]|nr:hypothetical protein [Terriglobales bacterium]